jgi:hypothetical protein
LPRAALIDACNPLLRPNLRLQVLMLVGNVFNCATAARDVEWDEAEVR